MVYGTFLMEVIKPTRVIVENKNYKVNGKNIGRYELKRRSGLHIATTPFAVYCNLTRPDRIPEPF